MFWEVTYDDLKTKIRLHIGERQALVVQEFQTISKIVALAFGDGKGKNDAKSDPRVEKPQTAEELKSAWAKVFR